MGQRYRYLQSLTLSTLLEHLGVVQTGTQHVMIDCLSNIVHSLMLGENTEATITDGMSTLGEAVKILISRHPGLRVYVASQFREVVRPQKKHVLLHWYQIKFMNYSIN